MANRKINISLLRILACFLVFMVHACQLLELNDGKWVFFDTGAVAPILFFELSGYVIAKSISKDDDIIKFYKKRFIRIIPMYYIMLIVWIIYYTLFTQIDIKVVEWAKYFTFLNRLSIPEIIQRDAEDGNIGALWFFPSLILFYLIAPFTLKKLNAKKALGLFVIAFILDRLVGDEAVKHLQYFFLGALAYTGEKESNKWLGIIFSMAILFYLPFWQNYNIYPYLFFIMIYISGELRIENNKINKMVDVLDTYTYGIYLAHPFVIELIRNYKEKLIEITVNWRYVIVLILVAATGIGAVVLTNVTSKKYGMLIK